MSQAERVARPTPYPDVNGVLQDFLGRVRAVLGDSFIGMYLYGSLAQGDFNHASSDIDFIVVTERDVTDEQFSLLHQMHKHFRASGSYWAEKIEAAYVQQAALNLPSSHSGKYPQLEKDRDFAREPLELGWPFQRLVLRTQGVVIAGPDPATLVTPVPMQELASADRAVVGIWQQDRSDPSWLEWVRQREHQRFFLVTLCRILYRLESGALASKAAAVQWGQMTLDERWSGLIEHSFMHRDEEGPVTDEELGDTLALLDYAMGRLTGSPDRP